MCGPLDLVTLVRELLVDHGADKNHIHVELYFGYATGAGLSTTEYPASTITFTLSGKRETAQLAPGESILEAALQIRGDAPYACMGGACGTCRAKLLDGNVEMDHNFPLGEETLDAGYVLTCQSHPTTPSVTVDCDA